MREVGGHGLLVHLRHEAARLFVHARAPVVEGGEDAPGVVAGVVLGGEAGALSYFEVALLPAQAPHDLAGLAVHFVDGGRPAGGDEQVAFVVHAPATSVVPFQLA